MIDVYFIHNRRPKRVFAIPTIRVPKTLSILQLIDNILVLNCSLGKGCFMIIFSRTSLRLLLHLLPTETDQRLVLQDRQAETQNNNLHPKIGKSLLLNVFI